MSSIFISKERGEYFKGYWFGFLIPILIGFSLNITILFLLINQFILIFKNSSESKFFKGGYEFVKRT